MRLIDADALKKRVDEIFANDEVEFKDLIDNAPTVEPTTKPMVEVKFDKEQMQELVDKAKAEVLASIERPQGELKEYKPLEVDYNVKAAVENLKTAYWSNDSEKYAKAFTEADQMIVSAICHYGYIVVKGGAE